jgi:hypothetical protein
MPPSGKLSVGIWKIRLREKWNMVKIDDSQRATIKSDHSTQAFLRKSMETKSKMAAIVAILDEWRS